MDEAIAGRRCPRDSGCGARSLAALGRLAAAASLAFVVGWHPVDDGARATTRERSPDEARMLAMERLRGGAKDLDAETAALEVMAASYADDARFELLRRQRGDLRAHLAARAARMREMMEEFWLRDDAVRMARGAGLLSKLAAKRLGPGDTATVREMVELGDFPGEMEKTIGRAEKALRLEESAFNKAAARREQAARILYGLAASALAAAAVALAVYATRPRA